QVRHVLGQDQHHAAVGPLVHLIPLPGLCCLFCHESTCVLGVVTWQTPRTGSPLPPRRRAVAPAHRSAVPTRGPRPAAPAVSRHAAAGSRPRRRPAAVPDTGSCPPRERAWTASGRSACRPTAPGPSGLRETPDGPCAGSVAPGPPVARFRRG